MPAGDPVRLLLGSGGFRTPERVALLAGQARAFFGPVPRLLFVPYALHDHDAYVRGLVERGLHAGYEIDGIHRHTDPRQAVRRAHAIFVGGGNTFRLLSELYRHGLLEVIRERVRAGLPYLGVSAGTNVACPTIRTTNDMPIVQPPTFDALGLVPFQVNPHYFPGQTHVKGEDGYHEHFGETRDDRLREFHEMNDAPVVGLWEAGMLRVEHGEVHLSGAAARLFRKSLPPQDLAPGARLDELLV
jgi:dipeptidase E